MSTISIIATSRRRLSDLRTALSGDVAADYLRLDDLPDCEPNDTAILDIELGQCSEVQAVKAWLSRRSHRGSVIVCIDDATSHLQLTQARAIGATAVLQRPLQAAQLHRILFGLELSSAPSLQPAIDDASQDLSAIEDMFAAARTGRSPSMDIATHVGAQIVDRIQDIGLSHYLSAIRDHHSRTYTHCLTVTAVAVSFGIQIGVGRMDRERLAIAGLLHDIGKSRIPIDILEKPAALDKDESAIIQAHPMLGYDMLRGTPGLPDDTLDMVLHHHEYLDGSGYPHGLHGSQISDLNRMMTISDVYGALIEPRAYRPPMEPTQALDILRAMGPKLDAALVRVFAPVACRLTA